MAASKRRRIAHVERTESSSDSDGGDHGDSGSENMENDEELHVDFEARIPDDLDFHGIQRLLRQLFLKAHIDVSDLADLLIKQNYICSVIKQSASEDMEEDGDDDDDDCFGVFSVVNVTEKVDILSIQEIKTFLLNHCEKSSSKKDFELFKNIVEDKEKHLGFIISERIVNIPPQIALPLYESLSEDMKKANEEKKPFDFAYYMIICKIYTDKTQPNEVSDVCYANAEEELFLDDAVLNFDFSVSGEQDTGLGGNWTEEDAEWQPKRRVMVFPAAKWESLLSKLRNELSST